MEVISKKTSILLN